MANLNQALGTDLAAIAKLLRSKGRGKDTVLAHITPKEAALLKARGGRGSINPDTGLPEYDDGTGAGDIYAPQVDSGGQIQAPVGGGDVPAPINVAPAQTDAGNVGPVATPQSYEGNYPTPQQISQPSYGMGATAGATPQAYESNYPTPAQLAQPSPGMGVNAVMPTAQQDQATPTTKPGYGDKLLSAVTDPNNLAKLGLTGALGLFGASQARKGANQVQAATQEQKAIGQPYTQQGQQLINQAQAGQLTPQSQQALNAAAAQLNQGIANRGGVGQQQAAQQLAVTYQSLLDNQYKYGLQIMQIGDNYATGAIKTGLQLDQQLQNTTNSFYTNLASILGGGNFQVPSAQRTA
jgi:hypothetical protein